MSTHIIHHNTNYIIFVFLIVTLTGWLFYTVFKGDGMNFYKTDQWDRKRNIVLRRDEYKCRECNRYGKSTPATVVHHINPIETSPELRLKTWNLISLCNKCHEAMHDRTSGELTEKGIRWIERIERLRKAPPHPVRKTRSRGARRGNFLQ